MFNAYQAVLPLKLFLVVLFLALIPFEIFSLPGQFAYMAKENPDQAYLRWPFTVITVFWVLCVQAIVVSTWKLLGMVEKDRIFSESAFAWVDAIVAAIAAGWIVLLGVFVYVGFKADDPGVLVLMFLTLIGTAVVGLLMLVMRALLRLATNLQTDMEGVL
jgi:hypothetical protein